MLLKARITDIDPIKSLLDIYVAQGIMLQRSKPEICEHLRDFSVYMDDSTNEILGVCALHIWWSDLGEIRSLAVRPECCHQGIGTSLVVNGLDEAKRIGLSRIFTLTVAKRFFENLGFTEIDKQQLPQKIWSDCIKCPKFPDCDETALIKYL